MPGCGKSTIARRLAKKLGCEAYDSDALIVEKAGMSIPEVFAQWGESCFRELETLALTALCKRSDCVISTGGGCVTREENEAILREGGCVIWLRRALDKLPTAGRPISQSRSLGDLYNERAPLYERFADIVIDNDGTADETTVRILTALKERRRQ